MRGRWIKLAVVFILSLGLLVSYHKKQAFNSTRFPLSASVHPTPSPTPQPTTPPPQGCRDEYDCPDPSNYKCENSKCVQKNAVCGLNGCELGEDHISCPEDCYQPEETLCGPVACADGTTGDLVCDPSCSDPGRRMR